MESKQECQRIVETCFVGVTNLQEEDNMEVIGQIMLFLGYLVMVIYTLFKHSETVDNAIKMIAILYSIVMVSLPIVDYIIIQFIKRDTGFQIEAEDMMPWLLIQDAAQYILFGLAYSLFYYILYKV